jgi:hypothetical protein
MIHSVSGWQEKVYHNKGDGSHWAKHVQGVHKRMVQFQTLTRNLFLTLRRHNVHRQQRQLSKFFMRYQYFASHAYCGAAGRVSKMASQHERAFCVLRFEVSRSMMTVQREFLAPFRTAGSTRSGHFKTEHTENLFLLWRHLGNCSRSKHEKRTAGSAWETWTFYRCWRCTLWPCKVRNKFLVNVWNCSILLYIPCIIHHRDGNRTGTKVSFRGISRSWYSLLLWK